MDKANGVVVNLPPARSRRRIIMNFVEPLSVFPVLYAILATRIWFGLATPAQRALAVGSQHPAVLA